MPLGNSIRALINSLMAKTGQQAGESITQTPLEPIFPKVLLIVYNPTVASASGRGLIDALGWFSTDRLVQQFIDDLRYASYGFCNYQIVERLEIDGFPEKIDGFTYSIDGFLNAWQARRGFHEPDWANYTRIIDDFDLLRRIAHQEIDEVWLFAFPYAGFYESRMAGPGAFWCNGPPVENSDQARRRFVIMGFNYERGVGEMLEAYGHRGESIMSRVFRRTSGSANLWERFTRYDQQAPGRAEVGNIHFAPNSQRDYDWGNRTKVLSGCDNWYRFPDLSGPARRVNCTEWGNGDIRQHHLWWFRHLPHSEGRKNDIAHNWWEYIVDPNRVN